MYMAEWSWNDFCLNAWCRFFPNVVKSEDATDTQIEWMNVCWVCAISWTYIMFEWVKLRPIYWHLFILYWLIQQHSVNYHLRFYLHGIDQFSFSVLLWLRIICIPRRKSVKTINPVPVSMFQGISGEDPVTETLQLLWYETNSVFVQLFSWEKCEQGVIYLN